MEYHLKTRSKKIREFIDDVLPSMIVQLGLTKSRKPLFINISRSKVLEGYDGLTSYLESFDAIVVLLRPCYKLEKLGLALAHEMVHVKQIAKGKLKIVRGRKHWNGKRYSNKTKYLDMPWEIEAFSKQELLFRRALE